MRIDHHAYQRATRVAGFGLLLQFLLIGIPLMLFGALLKDTAFIFAAWYVLIGSLVWLGLVIIFHQHKLERLEALEEDELASARGDGSVFQRDAEESHVAAKRLALMHRWLMPGLSVVIALALAGLAILMLNVLRGVESGDHEFHRTNERGWAVAICLAAAAVSFIFSRFVAGMAKQQAWQNLRGGAAYMAGNAVMLVAVAAGVIFRFFERDNRPSEVIEWIAWAIPIFMIGLALEIVLNFILHLYRPRIPGEVPRPAFDSKILSLLATPDSIVRSLNEAVNYQFGFDVTSSWGYQLLLRSFLSLVALGLVVLLLLSTIVVIEPHQQAIRLRWGKLVSEKVYESGVMWKWPWPIETAIVYDVGRVKSLPLTAQVIDPPTVDFWVNLWNSAEPPETDFRLDPFVVGSSGLLDRVRAQEYAAGEEELAELADTKTEEVAEQTVAAPPTAEQAVVEAVSQQYSLVDAEIVMQYRVKQTDNGLLDFLRFAPETVARRQELTDRERTLRMIAAAEVTQHLAKLSLEDVLSPGHLSLAEDLKTKIQVALDEHKAGVEVVAVDLPMLRPSAESAPVFEELGISVQARQHRLADTERGVVTNFAYDIGNPDLAEQVLADIDAYNRLRAELGPDAPETVKQREEVESLLIRSGGTAGRDILQAERDRWIMLMSRRAEASRVRGQQAPYLAAPRLYRVRELMRVYKEMLPSIKKYIIAIDPARLSVDADLHDINPFLNFAGASEEEMPKE